MIKNQTHWTITQPWKRMMLPSAATWMDLEGIMLSERSQTEEDNYVHCSLYVESKKWQTDDCNKTGTDVEDKELVTSGERVGRRSKIGERY